MSNEKLKLQKLEKEIVIFLFSKKNMKKGVKWLRMNYKFLKKISIKLRNKSKAYSNKYRVRKKNTKKHQIDKNKT